jgi:hypothetical protein
MPNGRVPDTALNGRSEGSDPEGLTGVIKGSDCSTITQYEMRPRNGDAAWVRAEMARSSKAA